MTSPVHGVNRLSSFLGFCPQLCLPSQLDQVSKTARGIAVPKDFAAQTEIQLQISRYTANFDGVVEDSTRYSLIQIFEGELNRVKSDYQETWTEELEIQFQAAKIYLFSLCLVTERSTCPIGSGEANNHLPFHIVMSKGFTAASCLILTARRIDLRTVPQGSYPQTSGANSPFLFYPRPYLTSIFFAAVFLLKFLVAQPLASHEDRQVAVDRISTCHQFFSQFQRSREHNRGVSFIELVGGIIKLGGGKPDLSIKSRFGASLIFDGTYSVYQFRKRLEQQEDPFMTADDRSDLAGLPSRPCYTKEEGGEAAEASSLPPNAGWTGDIFDDILSDLMQGNGFDDPMFPMM